MASPTLFGFFELKLRPFLFVVGGITALLLLKWRLEVWDALQQQHAERAGAGSLLWTPFSVLAFGGVFFVMPAVVLLALCVTYSSAGWSAVIVYALAGVLAGVLALLVLIKSVFLPRERRLFLRGVYRAPSEQTPVEQSRAAEQARKMNLAAILSWAFLILLVVANPAGVLEGYAPALPLVLMGFLSSSMVMLGIFLLLKRRLAWREEPPPERED